MAAVNTSIMPPKWSIFTHSFTELERQFNSKMAIKYVNETWTISLWFGAAYVILVHLGWRYMQDKPRYNLRMPLAIWSSVLAVFSIAGTLRSWPEFYHAFFEHDFEYSVCNPGYFLDAPSALWAFVMVYSKFIELGDTAFIILRKQPLIFLHWYHHLTVLIYGTYSYGQLVGTGRWYVVMNFMVHSIMYTYYALRAMRFSVPRFINMFITFSQIMQMVLGVVTNLAALYYLQQGHNCNTSHKNVFIAFALYSVYLILFVHFFYQAYLSPKKAGAQKQENGHAKVMTNGTTKDKLL